MTLLMGNPSPIQHYREYRHAPGFDAPSRRNILLMLKNSRAKDEAIRASFKSPEGLAEFDAVFAEDWAEYDAAIADLEESLTGPALGGTDHSANLRQTKGAT